jgi:segregation and condensation protein B
MDNIQTLKGKIEAVLFLTGRALTIVEISEKLDEPQEDVEFALLDLMADFDTRHGSALEIDDTEGYILQVRDTYKDVVNKMVPIEVSMASLRTLSVIALHGPLPQTDVIQARGSTAYEHIKELHTLQLISKRKKERSYLLNVTPKFYQYFKLTGDKEELRRVVQKLNIAEEPVEESSVLENAS